jgi:Rrf2 family nitric oxide-sensitive transcriptional repressor
MLAASDGGLLTVDELATALEVPRNHLAKVVQRLQRHGFAETVRGRAGGVRVLEATLARSVGSVVRVFEGEGEPIDCDTPPCPLSGGCGLRGALRAAQDAFLAALDDVPLRDLLAGPTGPVLMGLLATRTANTTESTRATGAGEPAAAVAGCGRVER